MFKYFIVFFVMNCYKNFYKFLPFKFFPIDNRKIVFANYNGLGYGCNPKYIAEELLAQNTNYKLIWLANLDKHSYKFPKEIKCVEMKSLRGLYELFTAKLWVDNYHKVSMLEKSLNKRKGQYFIQTWHGSFGIKKIEGDFHALKSNKGWYQNALKNAELQDFLISNSQFEDDVYKSAFWNKGKILRLGHPRNDIFFRKNEKLKQKIFNILGIDLDDKILIYVPTYRQGCALNNYNIDFDALKQVLEQKFGGKWKIVIRLHRNIKLRIDFNNKNFLIDATEYDDVQELLAVSDAAITDYSSCIFDFMLSKKPAFIYANDITKYNNERGFYYPLEETPFSIAKNNVELINNIKNFSSKSYIDSVDKFLEQKLSVEDGHASLRVVQLINDLMKG